MDGLASGVALIAALMLSIMFWQVQSFDLLAISLALGGSILGFLVFNFPPASIFMGDSGSLFLGFTLASLAIAQVPRASNLLAILGVPTLIFLLPILDTAMVTITRILRGQSPAQGGKDHTSHRLIAFGLSERQTVLVLYGVALLSGILGSFLEAIDYNISILLIPVLLLIFTLLTAYLARIKVVKTPQQPGSITRLMIGLTGRGRILEITIDLVLICLSFYLSFWLYFGTKVNILGLEIFLQLLPIAIAGSYISFFVFGIYRRVWQFVGIKDLPRFLWAALGAGIIVASAQYFVFPDDEITISIIFLFSVFLFLGLAASRSSFRLLDQLSFQQTKDTGNNLSVLICGADDIGVLTLQWLLRNPTTNYQAIGFLDNDPFKSGRQIQGINVVGSMDDLETVISKHEFQGIILTSNESITRFRQSAAMKTCEKHGIWFKRLQIDFEPIK
jgi:UDP-GlcNAc:undecaprenyl-phosphate GlcNAc-1-phosphate transferase